MNTEQQPHNRPLTPGPYDRGFPQPSLVFHFDSDPLFHHAQEAVATNELSRYLWDIDHQRSYNPNIPIIRRAHHQGTDWFYDSAGKHEKIITNVPLYEREGLPSSKELCTFVAKHWVIYLADHLPAHRRRVALDTSGHSIPYPVDVAGTEPWEAWQFVTSQSEASLRTLRSSGETTIRLTCGLDEQCQGCVIGLHCTQDRKEIVSADLADPENTQLVIARILPRDAHVIAAFLQVTEHHPQVRILHRFAVPPELQSSLGGDQVVTDVEAPLSLYRARLEALNRLLGEQDAKVTKKDL